MIYPSKNRHFKKIYKILIFSSFPKKKKKIYFFIIIPDEISRIYIFILNTKNIIFFVFKMLANPKIWRKKHMNVKHTHYMYLKWASISQPTVGNLHSQSYGGLVGPAPGHVSDGVPSPSQQQQRQIPLLHVLHTLPMTCNHNIGSHFSCFQTCYQECKVIEKMSYMCITCSE